MKLKTKLIPLASAAAVCATVAPIALTSCGSSKYIDLMKLYVPDFAKVESTMEEPLELNEAEALELWTDNVLDNPNYFVQENYWSESRNIQIINSKGMISNYDPTQMWKDIINPSEGGTVEPANPSVARLSNLNAANKDWTDVSNRVTYLKYQERMSDVSITTQKFTFKDKTSGEPKTVTWDIPTVSFTLEYDRTYTTTFHGSVVGGRGAISLNKFDMNATRENIGKLVFENVPLLIMDLEDRTGQGCWTVVPFIQWGCEDAAKSISYAKTIADSFELTTLSPLEWSITSSFTNNQVGTYKSQTNEFNIDWSSTTEESLSSDDIISKFDRVSQMSLFDYVERNGLFATWYIYNTLYKSDTKYSSLWNPDFFISK